MLWNAAKALSIVVLVVAFDATAYAQTHDVVEVTTGDRITGDVRRLERGRLAFRTLAASTPGSQRWAGTIAIVWTEVVGLTSMSEFDVELASGQRFSGSLSSPTARTLVVATASGPSMPIDMREIVSIIPIESGFRGRTIGSVDFGLNYTNAENARTYTLNGEAVHHSRGRAYDTKVNFTSTLSAQDEAERVTRNDAALEVHRRLPDRWFALAMAEVQQDESLELDARLVLGGGAGRMLVQSNWTLLSAQGGLDYDGERYSHVGSFDHSAEVFGKIDWDLFDGGRSTEAGVIGTTYFSLERQRVRLELDSHVRRDLFWDLYWSANFFESYDSDPPDSRKKSDLGVSVTFGWTF